MFRVFPVAFRGAATADPGGDTAVCGFALLTFGSVDGLAPATAAGGGIATKQGGVVGATLVGTCAECFVSLSYRCVWWGWGSGASGRSGGNSFGTSRCGGAVGSSVRGMGTTGGTCLTFVALLPVSCVVARMGAPVAACVVFGDVLINTVLGVGNVGVIPPRSSAKWFSPAWPGVGRDNGSQGRVPGWWWGMTSPSLGAGELPFVS